MNSNTYQHTNTGFNNSKSIAVLPFVNMSADPNNEYFSDGVTEEIINALTKIQGLKVIARTSSFAFKGKNIDIRLIGKQLGVNTILEGSVRRMGDRLRITAQLIDSRVGYHLWSKNFDRKMEDIFVLQDEISLLIADQIRENFGHLEIKEKLVDAPNIDVDNYQLFLKGKSFIKKFNVDDIKLGISLLKEVIERKPDFALAYANIHYAYNFMAAGGLMPMKKALSIGKQYLDRSIEIDNQLPESYHSLGWHSLNHDWDFSSATKYLMRAIELRPGYADAHQKLFINLALEGKLDIAFQHINTAFQLDPLSTLNNYFLGYYHYLIDDFETTNHYFKKTFEIKPSFIVGYSIYALSLIRQNRPERIFELADTIIPMDGTETEKLIMYTLAHCYLNNEKEARDGLQSLEEGLKGSYRERIRFFLIYMRTILGEPERAFDLIEEGIPHKEPLLTLLKVDPILKPLHKYKRFQEALGKIYALSDHQIPKQEPTKEALLNATQISAILSELNHLMTKEDVYLDTTLSLRHLSEKVEIHPNKLSWLLNEHTGKNFNEYINSFRLEAFKNKALDAANSHFTLLALAYESGFNSKTVFNTFFKKMEGMTPRAWVKLNKR